MAIQPIDLQALFTQVDKVGKTHALMRDGQQIQESLQQIQSQRKLEENIQAVNEAQDMGEEASKIKDEGRGNSANQSGARGKQEENNDSTENDKSDFIRDPALGRNIDISG